MTLEAKAGLDAGQPIITQYMLTKNTRLVEALCSIRKAFALQIRPKLTSEGTSGSYFLESVERKKIALFKPEDEEAFAPKNPKGYINRLGSSGFRQGILSGEAAAREVAAFLLDGEGFHGVPVTTFVEIKHPMFANEKRGSLQLFAKHDDAAENYGCNLFPVEEVHKIAILDVRILNCDRNDGNILVRKKPAENSKKGYEFQLIPIDHGLTLPDCFAICSYELVWMD